MKTSGHKLAPALTLKAKHLLEYKSCLNTLTSVDVRQQCHVNAVHKCFPLVWHVKSCYKQTSSSQLPVYVSQLLSAEHLCS